MNRQKKNIEAVYKHDLYQLLKNLGLLDEFKKGDIKCQFCKDQINKKNFGAIFPLAEKIFFSCSRLECITKLPKK